jgi:phosphatidylglycerophosphatase C
MSGRPVVAAFDFDGTLTTRDTLLPFLRFVVGRRRVGTPLASSAAGIVRASRERGHRDVVKERLLVRCLAGLDAAQVATRALEYAATIPLRADVVAKLRAHVEDEHRVLVVSASPTLYVAPAVAALGVDEVLATDLEVEHGRLTGRFAGRNCRGEEKVARLDGWLAGRDVEVYAYGNSFDDGPMLARAHHAVWV